MRINNNMSAVITNKQLLRTENNLTKSMERLSSGLKINHAKDNPAGMAISNKMQAQIDALDRASSNASDGTSVLQIADGALNETSAILQRMRELSVQAANGTNSLEDKQAIQDEIKALKDEVNRISKDTEPQQRQQTMQQMWESNLQVQVQLTCPEQFPSMDTLWILTKMIQKQKFMRKSVRQQRSVRQR